MEPGTWHAFPSIFDQPLSASPDERRWRSSRSAATSEWLATVIPVGDEPGIQFAVCGAAPDDVDELPPLEDLAPRMIRECLTAVSEARYAWDLVIDARGRKLRSTGLVCAELKLTIATADAEAPQRERSEVERAFERGLLDRNHRDIADFRLRMRPVTEQLRAIQASGYVPGWQVNVLFSTFRDEVSGQWVRSPLALAGTDELRLLLEPRRRIRGFRMTDLFG